MQFNPADFPVLGDDNQHNGVKVVQQPKLIVQQQAQPQQQKVKKVTIQSTTSHNKYITIITGLSKFYNMEQYENMCKQFRIKLACAANIDNKDIIVHGDFCLELGDYFKNQGVNIDVKNKFNRKQMMNIKWDQV